MNQFAGWYCTDGETGEYPWRGYQSEYADPVNALLVMPDDQQNVESLFHCVTRAQVVRLIWRDSMPE